MLKLLNKKIKLTQTRSGSKSGSKLKANLIGLGLRGIGSSVELKVNVSILGMIVAVNHLVKISYL